MRRAAVPAILLMLFFTACTDPDLQKVGKALTVAAKSVGELQTTVIEANKQGLITTDTTREILGMCIKVDHAGKQSVSLTKAVSKLDAPTKAQILTLLNPVIQSLTVLVDTGVVGIKNEETQQKVKILLLTIQSSLNTVQLVVASGG